jgi:hypothetical protein
MPGQFGPTRRVLFWVLRMSVMRTMSMGYILDRVPLGGDELNSYRAGEYPQ